MIEFDNSYARLPDRFFARLDPTPVAKPGLIRVNAGLAEVLNLDPDWLQSPEGVEMLAGNRVPAGAAPLAQAYAGHQFGGWSPQLGDGRAILLGEVLDKTGQRRDLQLKGAGQTPFSRMGDGRAWLGPVMREYLVSEAMAALSVPTTRALAAVMTGDPVLRETGPMPGAVLTRVASSHIRVGTFQYFFAREDHEALQALTDHVIARHYPKAAETEVPALALLERVIAAQADLVARWMSLGFIHGVMNTDNMSIAGETIDYGPCAFMDVYHPDTVFSSIDTQGRYAYRNQPVLAQWNLAQLATSLLPLLGQNREAALASAQSAVDGFMAIYDTAWLKHFSAKLGVDTPKDGDAVLITSLLDGMASEGTDFTQTFRALAEQPEISPLKDPAWHQSWTAWLATNGTSPDTAALTAANPAIIPRNHHVEAAIAAGTTGDLAPFHALTEALEQPFSAAKNSPFRASPAPEERVLQTFCGT